MIFFFIQNNKKYTQKFIHISLARICFENEKKLKEKKTVKEIKQPVSQPIRLHQFYFIDIFIIICFYISNARHAPSKSFQVCMLFFFLFFSPKGFINIPNMSCYDYKSFIFTL